MGTYVPPHTHTRIYCKKIKFAKLWKSEVGRDEVDGSEVEHLPSRCQALRPSPGTNGVERAMPTGIS